MRDVLIAKHPRSARQPQQRAILFSRTDSLQVQREAARNLRKKNIGFVFQNLKLIDELSVFENVTPAYLPGLQLIGAKKVWRKS
jgi:ABC-type lipoprotein export system ATPase subunit